MLARIGGFRLAALIPPPRLYRHRYHGVLAPNSPLRAAVTTLTRAPAAAPEPPAAAEAVISDGLSRAPARYLWAKLIARIYEVFPLLCRHGGAEMRIIAYVTETTSVTRILAHIGEPTKAPVLSPVRGPPTWEEAFDQPPVFDPLAAAPESAFEFERPSRGSAATGPCLRALRPRRGSRRSRLSPAKRGCCPASPMPGGPFLQPRVSISPRFLHSP